MAGRNTGKESRQLAKEIEAASMGVDVHSQTPVNVIITPNFNYVLYGMMKGYRIVALEGGTRSGKTYAALQWIVFACLEPKKFLPNFPREKLVVKCLRREAANARDSIWKDLNEILDTVGIKNGERGFMCNKTTMTWTFPNGSEISCGGASDKDKLHGIGQDIVFFNEVMQIPKSAFDQASYRTRIAFILDWNPSLNDHWVFRMGLDKTTVYGKDELPELVGKPKCLYAHSTYKDNYDLKTGKSNLSPYQIADVEQYEPTEGNMARGTANKFLWDVYGLGKRGLLEGRVIPAERVEIVPDSDFPTKNQWELHGYGLDWGYSDPTALVECAIFNRKLYVRELIYERGLIISPDPTTPDQRSVLGLMRELRIGLTDVIVADSARADLNAALRNAGFCVADAEKGGGSIMNGINLMNQRRWCVTDSSYNMKFELENYTWAKNRYGEFQNKPIDKFNHILDATRYWLTYFVDSGNIPKYSEMEERERQGKNPETEYACEMPEYF